MTLDEDAICAVVTRLSRPHPSGGRVIERAAIMAEGPQSAAILRWIESHAGEPEQRAAVAATGGLHSARRYSAGAGGGAAASAPRRYVLPPGAIA
jgi:hypothetical protein